MGAGTTALVALRNNKTYEGLKSFSAIWALVKLSVKQ